MKPLVHSLCGFFVFYLAASLSLVLTRQDGSIAIVWYANMLAGAYLSILPKSQWPVVLLAMAGANVAADLPYSQQLAQTLAFVPGNLVEIGVVAMLAKQHVFSDEALESPTHYLKAVLTVCLCGAALSACVGGLAISEVARIPMLQAWVLWFEGSLIGGVSVLPLLVLWHNLKTRKFVAAVIELRALMALAGCLTATWVSFLYLPYPYVYVIAALSATCFYTSMSGVVVASTAVALFAMILLATGTYVPAESGLAHLLLFYVPLLGVVLGPSVFALALMNGQRFQRQSEAYARSYEAMYAKSPALLHSIDQDGNILSVSNKWLELLGYAREDVIGRPSTDFLTEASKTYAKEVVLPAFFRTGYCNDVPYSFISASGNEVDVLLSAILEFDADGLPKRSLAYLKDISEEVALREELRRERDFMSATLSSIADAIVTTDSMGNITYINAAITKLAKYDTGDLYEKPFAGFFLFYDESSRLPLADPTRRCLEAGKTIKCVEVVRVIGGSEQEFVADYTASPMRDKELNIIGVSLVIHDVTESRENNRRMTYLAHHDSLTGLPNRNLFYRLLEERCATCQYEESCFSLLFLDIDNFKAVNDSQGHHVGDQLLQHVASRLETVVRAADAVCRFGGDEFVIIVNHDAGREHVDYVCGRIKEALSMPVSLAGQEFRLATSIGVVQFPKDGHEPDLLLRRADSAMYRSKEAGKDGVTFYHEEIENAVTAEYEVERDLKKAVETGSGISVRFQPIVDVGSRGLFALEVLVRWENEGEIVATPLFLKVAEQSGLIKNLSMLIFRKAFEHLQRWQMNDGFQPHLSLNLSGIHFDDPKMVENISALAQEFTVSPSQLIFEITETSLIKEPQQAMEKLNGLKAIGCRIAIDDFGTGYSSLSQVKKYPIDIIKIDKEFIRGLPNDAQDSEFVSLIVKLAEALDVTLIGEGVETEAQAESLSQLGCANHQGFLYHKPMMGDDVARHYGPDVVNLANYRRSNSEK